MVPETDQQIATAMRAKLATLDALLVADAADLDDEGRALIDALRRAAAELSRAIEATEGNARMTPSENPIGPAVDAAPAKPMPTKAFAQPIVAMPSRAFFIRRMVVAGVVVFGGLYLLYDGYKGWPDRNQRIVALNAQIAAADANHAGDDEIGKLKTQAKKLGEEKQPRDILLQKVLGFPVALLGVYLAFRFLREGKGELRLVDDTLHAPGHPPVPIAAITGVNDQKWDKKGVAVFDYRLADGKTGRLKIDDFVFDRPPTDAIHDELIAKMIKPTA